MDPMVLSWAEKVGAPQLSYTNQGVVCAYVRPLPSLKDIVKKVMFYC
jgi:hypothetical protein